MLNEWSDRAKDEAPASRWGRAADLSIAAMCIVGTLVFLVQAAAWIFDALAN